MAPRLTRILISAKATAATASRRRFAPCRRRARKRRAPRVSLPNSCPSIAGKSPSRATFCASLNAVAQRSRRLAIPAAPRIPKPDDKLSDRGFGTELRTDPVFLGLQKTRLLDPALSLPGTNDHPGDYRASGCSGCHVIYANDRDPAHSGDYAQFGHTGFSASIDPTTPKNEPGHPIKHVFTRDRK